MNKSTVWLVIVLLALSIVVAAATVLASAYVTPSVPQFTISFEAHPYYVPPEYGTDPYTGANITIRSGYTVNNESMVFTMKNQPFAPYTDVNGSTISLSYSIRGKGHFEANWKEFEHFESSTSEYTVKSYAYEGNNIPNIGYVSNGGQVDYQVEARVGYYTFQYDTCRELFTGEKSGWSPTLTLTIGKTTPTPSPFPYATPTPSPFNVITPTPGGESQRQIGLTELIFLVLIAFIFGAGLGLLIYLVKRK